MSIRTATPAAADLRARLHLLQSEHALAGLTGLADNAAYMTDLRQDLEATASAYVGAAVTEIASLRGVLDGRHFG